jgi:hypothetical protein
LTQPTDTNRSSKKAYRAPTLTVYGSVKELTGNKSGPNSGDAMSMMNSESDRSLKENIVRVGEHPAGFGLYLFDYKAQFSSFGTGRQFGVIADEVEEIVPEAVSIGSHGYRTVNYALLGITRH